LKRLILVALPITAAFGSLIPGLGSLFAFRLLILALLVYGIFVYQHSELVLSVTRWFRWLAVVWVLVGVAGIFFVPDKQSAVRELTTVFLGIALVISLLLLKDRRQVLRYIQIGWVSAFLLTGVVGIREFLTGQHLPNYLFNAVQEPTKYDAPASVFGNPNAFAVFLVTALPMLMLGVVQAKRRAIRFAHMVMIFVLIGLVLATGSRLCLYASAVEIIVLSLYSGRRYWRALIGALVILSVSLFFVGGGATDSLVAKLPDKLSSVTLSLLSSEVSQVGSSGNMRASLYLDGLWMIGDTAGMGVGPGNFEQTMRSGRVPYYADGQVDPHNVYSEIASQYGIVVMLLFAIWIISCWRIFWRNRRHRDERGWWSVAMLAALGGNAVSGLGSSSYLTGSYNWMFLATMMLAAVMIDGSGRFWTVDPASGVSPK
jgi:teichuronic acid biosynthesis protein TuaE